MFSRSLCIGLVFFVYSQLPVFGQAIDHWETIVYNTDIWRYFPGNQAPPSDWYTSDFNDTQWAGGPGGIGYGDDDDNTVIDPTISLFMRRTFTVEDAAVIGQILFHADYDDGFVAYLNGVEIARRNIGVIGDFPAFDQPSDDFHEASLYYGGVPEDILINASLVQGENVLAIQVHNENINSSDMSGNFFLSIGKLDNLQTYGNTPSWFTPPLSSSNLPLIVIKTLESSEIYDEPKVVAHMGIIDNGPDQLNFLTDDYNGYDGFIAIEIRGASSQSFPKKNYGFETQDAEGENNNVSLLGMPEENDWIFHGPYPDKSLMRNVLAYHMGRSTGRYAPRTRWCELVINGNYRGVYILTERIKRDENRVDIAKLRAEDIEGDELTGGYILQIDRDDFDVETDGWYSSYPDYKFYAYNYPDYEDIMPEQAAYIQDYMNSFEQAMDSDAYQEEYLSYVDVDSWVDYFLVTEIGKHIDAYKLSFYMHKKKESNGGKIHFGPLWDFNLGFGNFDFDCSPDPQGWSYLFGDDCSPWLPFWTKKLTDIPQVSHQINCRWEELRSGPLHTDSLLQFLDSNIVILADAQERNFNRWPILGQYVWPNDFIGQTYQDESEFLKEWLIARLEWMDENMIGDCGQFNSITQAHLDVDLSVYPNPVSSYFQVAYKRANQGALDFELYDVLGRKVLSTELTDETTRFSTSSITPGVYTYKIQSEIGLKQTGYLVIDK